MLQLRSVLLLMFFASKSAASGHVDGACLQRCRQIHPAAAQCGKHIVPAHCCLASAARIAHPCNSNHRQSFLPSVQQLDNYYRTFNRRILASRGMAREPGY